MTELSGHVHEDGMKAARRYAGWYLGNPSWADNIIRAYLEPQKVVNELDLAMGVRATDATRGTSPRQVTEWEQA